MELDVPLWTYQVARLLGVTKARVHQMCKEGMLDPERDEDGTRLFSLEDVEGLKRKREAVKEARAALRRRSA